MRLFNKTDNFAKPTRVKPLSLQRFHPLRAHLNSSRGFTLTELLIVVSIVTILTGSAVPSFSKYTRSQGIKQAREQLKSDLRTLQNNALTDSVPEGVALTAPMYWGVLFEANSPTYYYFTSTSDTAACSGLKNSNKTFTLPKNVYSVGTYCLFFNFTNGDATGDQTIVITDSNNIECIKVNSVGLISTGTWDAGGSVCN